jgi:hypothetical protein
VRLVVHFFEHWYLNPGQSKATVIASPINAAKAIKNEVEIQGFYNGNLRDSVAMVEFLVGRFRSGRLCFRLGTLVWLAGGTGRQEEGARDRVRS